MASILASEDPATRPRIRSGSFQFAGADTEHADEHIYVMDWGVTETLTFLSSGRPPLYSAADPFFTATPDQQQLYFISRMFADPQGVFVSHVREREVFTGVAARVVATAAASRYRKIFRLRQVSF